MSSWACACSFVSSRLLFHHATSCLEWITLTVSVPVDGQTFLLHVLSSFPLPSPQEGGLLLVAPEHRLSMELKLHELLLSTRGGSASTSGSLAAASVGGTGASSSAARAGAHLDARMAVAEVLQDVLYRVPYTDLLDESDEVLHHRWATATPRYGSRAHAVARAASIKPIPPVRTYCRWACGMD